MDEREQRQFIRFLAGELKSYTRELMAYQLVVHLIRSHFEGIDEMLSAARKSSALEKKLREQFEDLDKMLPPADPDYSETVKELLLKWKPPEGPLN